MWKDDAINENVQRIISLLADDAPDNFEKIIFVGFILDGSIRVSAEYIISDDHVAYPDNFFDYSKKLQHELSIFHQKFLSHGEDWKAVKVVCDDEGEFDIEFEYNDPYKWDS